MKKLLIFSFAILFTFCSYSQNWQKVKVKANRHYPTKIFCFDRSMKAEADIMFDTNCWYDRSGGRYNGLNKLFGISNLFQSVHNNSARFVWYPAISKDSIDIYFYCYLNHVSPQQNQKYKGFIKRVAILDSHNYKVLDYLNKYEFYIDDELLKTLETHKRKNYTFSYYHGLYIGGTFTLPFEISVNYIIHY